MILALFVAVLLHTEAGDIRIQVDTAHAPSTAANFLRYVEEKYYDGTLFHRVIPDFMIQGGGYQPDFTEKSQGLHEPIKNESGNGLRNSRGSIAMARC